MARNISVQDIRDLAPLRNARTLLELELAATKGKVARKCLACARDCVPQDAVIVRWRRSLTGRALHKGHIMALEAPLPKTRKALYVFLHECAHLHLHCKSSKSRHRREYEAEMYAHERMAEAGIEVPERMTANARRYVAWKIRQALRRGARRIDEDAYEFARTPGDHAASSPASWRDGGV